VIRSGVDDRRFVVWFDDNGYVGEARYLAIESGET
jgi:hypothetical protein